MPKSDERDAYLNELVTAQKVSKHKDYLDIYFPIWSKHQDIASHFNDLLLKIRTSSLAAALAISTVIGFMAKQDNAGPHAQIASATFFVMSIIWIMTWAIDFLHYKRLLDGTVIAIRKMEEKMATFDQIDLELSMEINDRLREKTKWIKTKVDGGDDILYAHKEDEDSRGAIAFYGIGTALLLILSVVSYSYSSLPVKRTSNSLECATTAG